MFNLSSSVEIHFLISDFVLLRSVSHTNLTNTLPSLSPEDRAWGPSTTAQEGCIQAICPTVAAGVPMPTAEADFTLSFSFETKAFFQTVFD
jgi:hypothetical protein